MNHQFDELAKGLAQSVTRRGALKKFGVGLAGIALASLGLANQVKADPRPAPPCLGSLSPCHNNGECCSGKCVRLHYKGSDNGLDGKFCA